MLVTKIISGGKEIIRIKITNTNVSALSQGLISRSYANYRYEIPAMKVKGLLCNHFREQSAWVLLESIFKDFQEKNKANISASPDAPQTMEIHMEIWPYAAEKNLKPIAYIKVEQLPDGFSYHVDDPHTSPYRVQGSGFVENKTPEQTCWILLGNVLNDMRLREILPSHKAGLKL